MALMLPLLEVEHVTLQYKTPQHLVTAIYKVDFQVNRGDRFVLLGPSGCGKSTLLKAVAGFMKPASGTIRLDGRTIERPSPDRMMVFQEFDQLLPWKTVLRNVMFPLTESGTLRKSAARERALRSLEMVHLAGFENVYPHMLSGGMKQRVAIARALAMEPSMLLMDEPFASLDALTRRTLQDELLHLWDALKFTVLFVTHSIEEAIRIGNRILLLSPHPGQVRAELRSEGWSRHGDHAESFIALERQIHDILFTDQVEDTARGKTHA